MNTKITNTLRVCRANAWALLGNVQKGEELLKDLIQKFSETVDINPYGSSLWVEVDNREDLQLALTLAPKWAKNPNSQSIRYEATVGELPIIVIASNSALPPTCKLVEETYEIPAEEAKPARKGTRMVLKCDPVPADIKADEVPAINPAEVL